MLDNFREVAEQKKEVKKHNDAVVFPYGTATVTIKPLSDKGFQKRFDVLMKPYKRTASKGRESEERCTKILARAVADQLVTNWKGVYITEENMKNDFPEFKFKAKNGNCEIPYSVKNCFTVLSHPNYKEFLLWIKDMANDEMSYVAEIEEENAKN